MHRLGLRRPYRWLDGVIPSPSFVRGHGDWVLVLCATVFDTGGPEELKVAENLAMQ